MNIFVTLSSFSLFFNLFSDHQIWYQITINSKLCCKSILTNSHTNSKNWVITKKNWVVWKSDCEKWRWRNTDWVVLDNTLSVIYSYNFHSFIIHFQSFMKWKNDELLYSKKTIVWQKVIYCRKHLRWITKNNKKLYEYNIFKHCKTHCCFIFTFHNHSFQNNSFFIISTIILSTKSILRRMSVWFIVID